MILGIDVAKNQIDWQVHSDTHITNFINLWELTTYFPRKTLESAIKSIILVYVGYAFYIWDVSVQMIEKKYFDIRLFPVGHRGNQNQSRKKDNDEDYCHNLPPFPK